MYTCKDSINLLLDFLDGELTPEDTQHLREHLQGCSPCVDFLRTYRATPGLCKKALAQRMPQEMSSKLTEFLRSKIKSAS
jgi:anti-sigma factor RsiW